jgi:TonB-linked SusC/RagA family outer membrane protein
MNYCYECNEGLPFYLKRRASSTKRILKYLVVMKLILLITFFSLQVSAAIFAQQITLSYENAPLKEVMQAVRKQSGYYFFIESEYLKMAKPVTVKLNQASIEKTLEAIFANQPFDYQIDGKAITLTPKKESSIIEKVKSFFSVIDIKGKVTDELGNALPGASVKAGGKVAVTNGNGEFYISGIAENATVEISYIGYTTKTLKAGKGDFIIVQLVSKAGDLSETIIKGYYSTTKTLNTGSVGSIKTADITKQPVSDPLMALEGRISGLYISQTSGVPGASINIFLRGQNSIANGNSPLYIIDGIPFNSKSLSQTENAAISSLSPFANFRASDVESIDVLKDADATAIYGSRGANGVILITTKKGKEGKTKFNVNLYSGTGKIATKLNLLNTKQYLEMRNESFRNDNDSPQSYEYDLNGTWDTTRYTDWQKVLIGGLSKVTDVSANLSGGNAQTQFIFGVGYRRETTVFPGDFSDKIGSAHVNINHNSNDKKFDFNLSASYSNNNNQLPKTDLTQSIFMAPNAPAIYDNKGQLNWENNTFKNPVALLLQKSMSVTENLISNLTVAYNIIDGLQLKGNLGYNSIKLNDVTLIPFSSLTPNLSNPPGRRINNAGFNAIKSWIAEPQISYTKTITNHHFDALVAATFQENIQNGLVQQARGFSSDEILENPSAATILTSSASYTQYRYSAFFARLGYDYLGKYILNFTGRRDGSSRFGPKRRFGNFGAIGAAWVFSKESWIKESLPFLSLGKLRGSIGKTGNDQLTDYDYLSTFLSGNNYFGTSGLYAYKLTNPYYGWETINKTEAAIELGILRNRILLTTNLYRNRTSNQLVGYSLPAIAGFTTVTANLPAVIENKGIEIELNTVNVKATNFRWNTSVNITFPRNKLVSYPNIESSSYANTYAVGQSLSSKLLFKYEGVDKETGLYTFKDLNKDGAITSPGDVVPVFVGQRYYGGINNSFSYKGLSLDIFFQFVKQTGFSFKSYFMPGLWLSTGSNQPVSVLDRWRSVGDLATNQKFSNTFEEAYTQYNNFVYSDGDISDASFIRLKNISLSWNLPESWNKRVRLQNARIYLQAQNLWTITNFKGMDPESQQFGQNPYLPPLRILTAGIQISL